MSHLQNRRHLETDGVTLSVRFNARLSHYKLSDWSWEPINLGKARNLKEYNKIIYDTQEKTFKLIIQHATSEIVLIQKLAMCNTNKVSTL